MQFVEYLLTKWEEFYNYFLKEAVCFTPISITTISVLLKYRIP